MAHNSKAICAPDGSVKPFSLEHRFCLKKLEFGNLMDETTFLSYEAMRPINDDRARLFMEENLEKSQLTTNIWSDFEHDRSEFVIKFPYLFQDERAQPPVEELRIIMFCFKYESFQRLVVSGTKDSEKCLFIGVKYPPKIFSVYKRKLPNKKEKWSSSRRTTWGRKEESGVRRRNIADATTIMLTFDEYKTDEFDDLFGRLLKHSRVVKIETLEGFVWVQRGVYRAFIHNENVREEFGISGPEHFELIYCLNALISRGGLVKDLLLLDIRKRNEFLRTVTDCYRQDERGTIDILEQLLCQIDETRNMKDLSEMFNDIKSSGTVHLYLEQQRNLNWEGQGYVRVKKVIITPTRNIFVTSELMLGNRVLRKEGVDNFLRIVFRDEDGTRLSKTAGDIIVDKAVKQVLTGGLKVVNRDYVYVGSSNSQLRDNGCYFMIGKIEDAVRVRKSMGRFKIEKVPKMMARMGQCFTQSKLSQIQLDRRDYTNVADYMNCGSTDEREYNFSDGVGSISLAYAKAITRDLVKTREFNGTIPSCFQFRFRGYKGVLCVNRVLDKQYKFLKKIKCKESAFSVEFRESQQKFRGPREDFIEIVKYSAPSPVCLNKPMINIMDQVSMKQNSESHRRIQEHVLLLLTRHMNRIMRALNHENDARRAVAEFPQIIPYQELARISLTQEPFFRSMLRAWAKSQLAKLLSKMKIQIPPYHGRTMFGVVDETGILQYGQVYVSYHSNHSDKFPAVTSERIILEGRVLVTKNPAVVSGDVRILQAVNIPSLRHLSNVIVFPQHGPRPHPDEMAGSDLDGDEYSVIWDHQLMFDHNEEPFDYTGAANNVAKGEKFEFTGDDDGEELQKAMSDFFVEYMKQDSIGKISNAFLSNSDLFGIESQVCNNIALKHNKSVDFPKTGVAPDELTHKWDVENDLPPEKVEYHPDFMDKPFFPTYQSPRLLGECHRSVQSIQSVIEMAEFEKPEKIVMDFSLFFDGWEKLAKPHIIFIKKTFRQYSTQMRALMETYGIQNEGELFCGHYIEVKGKATDAGNNDDVSLFNMSTICQQRLEALFSSYRKKMFDHFQDGMNYLEPLGGTYDFNNVLGMVCRNPTDEMKAVALKCYQLAYEQGEFISFPWLMWDVLVSLKRKLHMIDFNEDPLNGKITKIIDDVRNQQENKFEKECRKMEKKIKQWPVIHHYVQQHVGLGRLLCYLACWRDHHKIEIDPLHLCVLVIKIGNGELETDLIDRIFLCKEMDLGRISEFDSVFSQRGLGRVLIDIFGAFASNFFRRKEKMLVVFAGRQFTIMPSEIIALHAAAIRTYYQLSLSDSISVLPNVNADEGEEFCSLIEGYPISIKVPRDLGRICSELIKKCGVEKFGCSYVATKVKERKFDDSVSICLVACGKMGNVMQFYDALSITPQLDLPCREKVLNLAEQTSEKLRCWNNELNAIKK